MPYNVQSMTMADLIDGVINFLGVNLVANTFLTQDAHIGDTVIHVDNAVRFNSFNQILLMDNNSTVDPITSNITGAEFHTIALDFYDTSLITLQEPLQQDFNVANNGRLQKT